MSSGHQRITWRRNIAENFNRLSRVHERYRQTDDRQTDGRRHIANVNMSSRSLIKLTSFHASQHTTLSTQENVYCSRVVTTRISQMFISAVCTDCKLVSRQQTYSSVVSLLHVMHYRYRHLRSPTKIFLQTKGRECKSMKS